MVVVAGAEPSVDVVVVVVVAAIMRFPFPARPQLYHRRE